MAQELRLTDILFLNSLKFDECFFLHFPNKCDSHNAEFDRKPGAPPNLYLLNKEGQRVEVCKFNYLFFILNNNIVNNDG